MSTFDHEDFLLENLLVASVKKSKNVCMCI